MKTKTIIKVVSVLIVLGLIISPDLSVCLERQIILFENQVIAEIFYEICRTKANICII